MDISYYKKYEPIFGSWHIVRELGEGSFGKVFEIEREDFGYTYKSALKAISIPQTQSEVKSLAEEMDIASITSYYRGFVEEMVREFNLMSKLKGHSNIVSYEDHSVVQHGEDIGWDILIRMELLTPLVEHVYRSGLARNEVIKLGIDMCKALEACRKFQIIHRDIKPENIFISELGDFKLGDFGIAKTVEKTTGGLSKKGTYTYMAPEIFNGEKYGPSIDIYSLGLVLYRYMNNNRAPFLPAYPEMIKFNDRETAMARRIKGERMPAPANADKELAKIILKACAYDPKDRYASPTEMLEALEAVLHSATATPLPFGGTSVNPVEVGEVCEPEGNDRTVDMFNEKDASEPQTDVEDKPVIPEPEMTAEAQNQLGEAYYNGDGVPQDFGKAFEWYLKAAERGNPVAQYNVGYMYHRGEGVPQDYNKALEWYMIPAELGYSGAQCGVGLLHFFGLGVPKDYYKAFYWLEKSAKQDYFLAQNFVGTMYFEGQGVEKDQSRAFEWCMRAAERGFPPAQFNVGYMYQNGFGVTKDNGKAVEWLEKSAEQGYVSAIEALEKHRKSGVAAISAGFRHTVALKADGTVAACGPASFEACNVAVWKDIAAISASRHHTAALFKDGSVADTLFYPHLKSHYIPWGNIVAVAAGNGYTLGLTAAGTVSAVCTDSINCKKGSLYEALSWRNIVAISSGGNDLAGLKSDGTVVCASISRRHSYKSALEAWQNIAAISVGDEHTVGLKPNGTVVAAGSNKRGQCSVQQWQDIVAVSAGGEHTVGLKSDGTVVATGSNSNGQCNVQQWQDIVEISAGTLHTVGLKKDGTLLATGNNVCGQCDIDKLV